MPQVIPFDSDYIQKVLKRIKNKNDHVQRLVLGNHGSGRNRDNPYSDIVVFNSNNGDDFSRLGRLIGKNTDIIKLSVAESNLIALDASNRDFYDGLTRNSSINDLYLSRNRRPLGEVAEEILRVYQENNTLTRLVIVANLRVGHTLLGEQKLIVHNGHRPPFDLGVGF